ncbi:hypothetical protein DFJ73DRAFT_588444 [Zopfochytrium polystomum]|nr:hypothetical protein DFJ73DRAFT_588444 [Zopfochytrium polystomum]
MPSYPSSSSRRLQHPHQHPHPRRPPARSTSTTAAPAATGTALPQTCSIADNCATYDGNCVNLGAGSQGFIRFSSPIATSVALVGNTFNISWTYDSVNTTQFPANQISLYYALTTSSVTGTTSTVTAATWYQHLVATLPPNAMSFNWTVPSLEAGQYKIRIVADRLDPDYATSLNQFQCIFPGQPIPTSSAAFRVLEAGELIPYTDKYPPQLGRRTGRWDQGSPLSAAICRCRCWRRCRRGSGHGGCVRRRLDGVVRGRFLCRFTFFSFFFYLTFRLEPLAWFTLNDAPLPISILFLPN